MSPKESANALYGVSCIVSYFVIPITRGGHGKRSFRWFGPMALLGLFLASGLSPLVLYYIPLWLLAVVFRRLTYDREAPTRFSGYPGFLRIFGSKACYAEGALLLGIGYLIADPIGMVIMAAGASIIYVEVIEQWAIQSYIDDMGDAAKIQRGMTYRIKR